MKRLILCVTLILSMCVSTSLGAIVQDNFNDGILGPSWEIITQTGGTFWNESSGTLNVGGSSGQADELVIRYNQALADVGSVRIDYNWIFFSGHKARVGLGLFDSSWIGEGGNQSSLADGVYIKGVRYINSRGHQHAIDGSGTDTGYQIAYSVPTSGSFMIERSGNDFRARYLDGGNWQDLFLGHRNFGGTPIYPYLFTSNSNTYPSWQVALDNFQADVIPEPSTLIIWSLLALCGICFGWYRRRKMSKKEPPRMLTSGLRVVTVKEVGLGNVI